MAGATLLSLPPEVLTLIFTNPSGLVAIRSVCKKFCKAADRAFALEFISTRDHVASPYSINALVAISAHSFFGPFVKTIRMNAFRALTTIKSPDKTHPSLKAPLPRAARSIRASRPIKATKTITSEPTSAFLQILCTAS